METTTIFDEHATAYNVIVTEHGSFILSNYEPTATDDGSTVHEVELPIDPQSTDIHQHEEVIILNTSEMNEHIGYEKYVKYIFELMKTLKTIMENYPVDSQWATMKQSNVRKSSPSII